MPKAASVVLWSCCSAALNDARKNLAERAHQQRFIIGVC